MHLQSWVHSQLAWRSCFNVCLVGLPLLLQAMCFANPPTRNTHGFPWCCTKCSLAPTKMSWDAAQADVKAQLLPCLSLFLSLATSYAAAVYCSLEAVMGVEPCWIDAGHCNMRPQIMQNTQAARDPNKDTWRPLLETWPLQRTAEMDPCVDRWNTIGLVVRSDLK